MQLLVVCQVLSAQRHHCSRLSSAFSAPIGQHLASTEHVGSQVALVLLNSRNMTALSVAAREQDQDDDVDAGVLKGVQDFGRECRVEYRVTGV